MVSRRSGRTPGLSDRIYLVRRDGYYYSYNREPAYIRGPDANCEIIVEYLPNNPDEFYLRTPQGDYFHRHSDYGGQIDYLPLLPVNKYPIRFTLLDLGESQESDPDTFVFRASNGEFLWLTGNKNYYALLHVGSFEDAKIKIGDPTLRKLTGNIVYALQSSKVDVLTPEVILKTTVRNDSQTNSTRALTYHYRVSHTGSWTNEIGVRLPSNAVAEAKIPSLVDGKIFTVAAENYSHVNPEVETKTVTSSVFVPASTRGVASVLINRTQIQVPFTYTEEIWWRGGGYQKKTKNGTYSHVVTNGVEVELTDLISITHTIPVDSTSTLRQLEASPGLDSPLPV